MAPNTHVLHSVWKVNQNLISETVTFYIHKPWKYCIIFFVPIFRRV